MACFFQAGKQLQCVLRLLLLFTLVPWAQGHLAASFHQELYG